MREAWGSCSVSCERPLILHSQWRPPSNSLTLASLIPLKIVLPSWPDLLERQARLVRKMPTWLFSNLVCFPAQTRSLPSDTEFFPIFPGLLCSLGSTLGHWTSWRLLYSVSQEANQGVQYRRWDTKGDRKAMGGGGRSKKMNDSVNSLSNVEDISFLVLHTWKAK